MRVQVMAHEGPFNGTLFTYNAVGTVPKELRLASIIGDIIDGNTEAAVYRMVDEELHEAARTTFASYRFIRTMNSAISLVDHWIIPEEGT